MRVRNLQVEQYRRMIAGAAWRAWHALPVQTRAWIEVEDLIEDAMLSAYHYSRKWKLKTDQRGVGILQNHIKSFLINHYIEKYGADKQGWIYSPELKKKVSVRMYSLQGMQERLNENSPRGTLDDIVHSIPDLVVSPDSIMQRVISECFVVPCLTRVYRASSDNLKEHLVEWLWQTKNKVHKKSSRFKDAAKEFRTLCRAEDLEYNDCLHLVRSPQCLDSLSRSIFEIPYVNDCVPIVSGEPVHTLIN